MAGPNVPDEAIFSVIYDGIYLSQQVMNTFHYQMAVSGTTSDLTTVYAEFRNALDALSGMTNAYLEQFTSEFHDIKLHIQMVYPVRYVKDTAFAGGAIGTRTPGTINPPPNDCAALTLRSLLSGPHEKGTKHILSSHPDDIADGQVGSGFATLLADFGAIASLPVVLTGAAASYEARPCVLNRLAPGSSKLIASYAVQPHSRILRRRTVGHGT